MNHCYCLYPSALSQAGQLTRYRYRLNPPTMLWRSETLPVSSPEGVVTLDYVNVGRHPFTITLEGQGISYNAKSGTRGSIPISLPGIQSVKARVFCPSKECIGIVNILA